MHDQPGHESRISFAIIPHPHMLQVLMLPASGGWDLPSVTLRGLEGDSWWREVAPVNEAFGALLGWRVTTRSCAGVDTFTPEVGTLFVLELHDLAPAVPRGGRWVDVVGLEALPLAIPAHRSVLLAEFATMTRDLEMTGRLAWTRPGWFTTAAMWLEEHVHAHGLAPVGPVEQVRTWHWSCILQVATTEGVVYLKAAPPIYVYEPVLTQALAQEYPERLAPVLAVEPAQGWLLMAGVGGVKLRQHPDEAKYLPRWEALLRDMTRIQRNYIARVPELVAWGCLDLRPAHLADALDPLLADLAGLLTGRTPELSIGEVATIESLAPQLKQMCVELEGYGIPATLTHGDFHSGNILATENECRVLDWAGFVGIAHPFCCLSVVFEEHGDPVIRARLRDIYLEGWTDYAPLDQLRRAVDLAVPLGLLSGALGHHLQVTTAPPLWDAAVARANLAWCLRELIKAMPSG